MGVLGWTEKDTLDSSLHGIVSALESRKRFIEGILLAVFGSKSDTPAPAVDPARPMSTVLFDAIWK